MFFYIMEKEPAKKITLADLIGIKKSEGQSHSYKIANNQKEYSHTQKIKPWRVGGHQQQIAPKGFKKGFRK